MSNETVKLTHAMRDMIVQQVRQEYESELSKLRQARDTAALALERAAWGDRADAFYTVKHFLPYENTSFEIVGRRSLVYVPTNTSDARVVMPDGEIPIERVQRELDAYTVADDALDEAAKRRDEVLRDVKSALAACRTIKTAFEKLPALRKYEAALPSHSAPANVAIIYDDLNARLAKAQQQ